MHYILRIRKINIQISIPDLGRINYMALFLEFKVIMGMIEYQMNLNDDINLNVQLNP